MSGDLWTIINKTIDGKENIRTQSTVFCTPGWVSFSIARKTLLTKKGAPTKKQEYRLDDFCRARPPVFSFTFPAQEENCPLDEYYYVSIDGGELLITIEDSPETEYTNICELDVDGGKLIGINNGEFGGGLFFVTKNIENIP